MRMQAAEALVADHRAKWTLERFEQAVETGVFDQWPVELVRGELVEMTRRGPSHADVIEALSELLIVALTGRARVRVQLPLIPGEDSYVGPDIAVLDKRTPRGTHPRLAKLIIEVADSSLRFDRSVKAPLYAGAGVPEYWVIDVQKRAIDVFSGPKRGAYTKHARVTKGSLAVPGFEEVRVSLADLFE